MADKEKSAGFPAKIYKVTSLFGKEVPSQVKTQKFVDKLVNTLFIVRDNKELTLKQIEAQWESLQVDLTELLCPLYVSSKIAACESLTEKFFAEIPSIYDRLLRDADCYYQNDPSSTCREEIVLCYPGFYAVTIYRFANVMYRLKIPILPRVLSEYAHSKTGIDINPGATIGDDFYIDHGTGIVIGETAVIGKNVKIYQGVTLGATYVNKDLCGTKRHPTIGDNVIIYAGATILGGDTVIGKDAVIGGNVWLTESVPPGAKVYYKPETVIKDPKDKKLP